MPPVTLIAVLGATATGKSDLAVDLALALDGEVINADALQLYRGMDIGTAKIPPAERRGVPHHLLDVLDVTQEASVSAYQRDARALITRIRDRGRMPILVGGSGLYLRAVLDRISFPPTDPLVRARLEEEVRRLGTPALHARLAARDPEAATMIGVHDARRIVRALEVGELTGGSFRAFLPSPEDQLPGTLRIGVHRERGALHERVAHRVDGMIAAGLIEETARLRELGLDRGVTARRAIGYEQAIAVLEGRMSLPEAREEMIVGTRRLIRKQDTWFRRDARVRWVGADPGGDEATRAGLAAEALAVIRAAAVSSRA